MKPALILVVLIVGSLASGCASLVNACGQVACTCAAQLAVDACIAGVDSCANSGALGAQGPRPANTERSTEKSVHAASVDPVRSTPMRF